MNSKWKTAADQARRRSIMKSALADGMVTDRIRDGVCEQLVSEGWLERAAAIAPRPHLNPANAYLPTTQAIQTWADQPV